MSENLKHFSPSVCISSYTVIWFRGHLWSMHQTLPSSSRIDVSPIGNNVSWVHSSNTSLKQIDFDWTFVHLDKVINLHKGVSDQFHFFFNFVIHLLVIFSALVSTVWIFKHSFTSSVFTDYYNLLNLWNSYWMEKAKISSMKLLLFWNF